MNKSGHGPVQNGPGGIMGLVPDIRIKVLNQRPVNPEGKFVLYWMIANRRTTWNFALDEAIDWAQKLKKPLVVFEPLRCDYPWASDRFHKFILEGMAENQRRFSQSNIYYYPYVETKKREGRGSLQSLANLSSLIITDHFPGFFLPRMVEAAASQVPVRLIQVDSNGLLPLRAAGKTFPSAYSFRRFLQKNLLPHLSSSPQPDPLLKLALPRLGGLPSLFTQRWPKASMKVLAGEGNGLALFPINHSVGAGIWVGGEAAAQALWKEFLAHKLPAYEKNRNQPEMEGTSGLSPYLHFGHISVHQLFSDLMKREKWSPEKLSPKVTGSRSGWWGVSAAVEGFLDQLITWRELGYNMADREKDYDQYESLPDWARATLKKHARDPRPYLYEFHEFERAKTHDLLWNAAQMQLVREGRIHNYLRMLWGKKILEWSPSPQEALSVMIELNNKYALDGRDPNSYSGIFWVLGRYDRPWGPERTIFGKIRYMSSENTGRKIRIQHFIKKYAPGRKKGS